MNRTFQLANQADKDLVNCGPKNTTSWVEVQVIRQNVRDPERCCQLGIS